MIDLEAVRAETPACESMIFLDSAGSSLPPRRVVDAVIGHVRREAEVGGYRAAAERADDLAALPDSLGRLLHAEPRSIALTDSATRSWTQIVTAVPWRRGDRVLVTGVEYASNAITLLQLAERHGLSIERLPSTPDGRVDLDALGPLVDDRVRLVSLVHVPTNGGLVNPVREVVDAARRVGALVLLDACQSVGQLDLDVAALGVDALSGTGRKWLRGPRGTGFLYVRPEVLAALEPAAADMRGAEWIAADAYRLRADAARFELWEYDVAGRLGLREAVDYLLELGPRDVEAAVCRGAARLREGLAAVPGVTVHDQGPALSGLVSFTVDGLEPDQVAARLALAEVTVTVSGRSSTRYDMTERGLEAVVRASPHYFVSDAQIDAAVAAVAVLAR
jgi:cysteine desulfurase / selenocysteine lyase